MNVPVIVSIILLISFSVAIPWMCRSILWNRALKFLKNGKYDEAQEIFESKKFISLFGKFSSEWNLLRLALSRGDKYLIESKVNKILNEDFKKSQRVTVAKAAYFYFLDLENKEMCQKLLSVIQSSNDLKEVKQSEMLYRVIIEHKSDDIDFVLELLNDKKIEDVQKGLLQYILGLQYLYSEDEKNSQKYLKKAKDNLKNTPYNSKVKKALGR